MATRARALTIAGSDSGGGAGIQADLKTFAAHGVYGMSALTAVTAQNTLEVRSVHPVPAAVVADQIDAVFEDLGVDAVKIGMLGEAATVRAVAAALERHGARKIVLDPVMIAKSGDRLLAADAVDALRRELIDRADLVTPNLPEAEALTGLPVAAGGERLARALVESGARAALVKGGHAVGDEIEDVLVIGDRLRRFVHPRVATRSTHGTGCTLSAAIAAGLAVGRPLEEAVGGAIGYLARALAAATPMGRGHGPVEHGVPTAGDGG